MSRWRVRPEDVVLGTVPAEDRAEAERLIRGDPAFRARVEELRRVGDAVRDVPDAGWARATPPPLDLGAALAARPPRTPAGWRALRPTGPRRGASNPRLVLRPVAALAAAVALVLAGGLTGAVLRGGDDGADRSRVATAPSAAPGRTVALRSLRAPDGQRAAVRLPARAGGEVRLAVTGAAPSRAGEYYELWLLDDTTHLTSVGTFRVGADGRARGSFGLGVDPGRYRFVDVSVERDDGDPAHSRRSVLRSAPVV